MKQIRLHLPATIGGLLFGFLVCVPARSTEAVKSVDERLRLRNETAIHYDEPSAHLRLARYHYDLGNKVQAFYIAEFARKMSGDEKFTPVFEKVAAIKLLESPSFKDEAALRRYCQKHPDSVEAQLQALDSDLKSSAAGTNGAAQSLERILARFPRHVGPKAVAAKFYLKTGLDEERALALYIELYFQDPHYYDGEYAESRIKGITSKHKEAWWTACKQSGRPLKQLVAEEKNPRALDAAADQANEKWEASLVPVMLTMLDNDDPTVQTNALQLLCWHPEDLTEKETVRAMLKDDDLVKRAMAAFLVVNCLGPTEYPLLQENLDSGIKLVQLDAIQALASADNPKGREYLKAHPPAKASKDLMDYWRELVSQKD